MTTTATSILTARSRSRLLAVAMFVCAASILALAPACALAAFGLESAGGSLAEPGGTQVTRAGGHPDFTTTLHFNTTTVNEKPAPDGNVKDVHTMLAPGLVGFPNSFQRCTQGQLKGVTGLQAQCPVNSQVGIAEISNCVFGCGPSLVPIYNMAPPPGVPGQFALNFVSVLVFINVRLRHDSAIPGGYALQTDTEGISQTLALSGIKITLWGVPADPAHDPQRYFTTGEQAGSTGAPASSSEAALMRSPTSCSAALSFGAEADSWAEPAAISRAGFTQEEGSGEPLKIDECRRAPFAPTLSVHPTTTRASAPTGLEVELGVPQSESPRGISSADLRSASITLPPGMTVNPSAADGLQACGQHEIDLASEAAPSCPAASKIGQVKIVTPLLEAPLEGSLYQARQNDNPFASTLALYLLASGPGVVIKLAGLLAPDPRTGQLTATFTETPQLPFSSMTLRFKGGERAPLSNPGSCGPQTVNAQLGSWGETTASVSSSFTLTGPCAQRTFAPGFSAGSTGNLAAALTGFTFSFARNDGEQSLGAVFAQLPPGLLGYIKNVPLCGEPQAAAGTCGEQSLIGSTTVAAGAGSSPLHLAGRVYLTGPYRGAPYGLAVVVPALAGPFDLGLVVVRASINVDPRDAHISVASSPLPTILDGIPLQLRDVAVTIDRPSFMFNGTSCAKRTVAAAISGVEGASAPLTAPYQLSGCAKLPFKPTLSASSRARASKANGAYLHVRVASGAGQANIGEVAVSLPRQLPSRLTTLQKACPAARFEANPGACPSASIVGRGRAVTPVFSGALAGPAYLVSHGNAEFPDLEIVLQGEGITLVLDGKTHIRKGITSSTFDTVPDAPIASFDLDLPQGPHSVFTAFGSLCKNALKMPTTLVGQNGARITKATRIAVSGCRRARPRRHASR